MVPTYNNYVPTYKVNLNLKKSINIILSKYYEQKECYKNNLTMINHE